MVSARTFDVHLMPRQMEALRCLQSPEVREVLYGGAKGGGKSYFGCVWSFLRACEIIRECKLAPRANPIPVGWIGRKQNVDLKNTTLETWKRFIPADLYEIRASEQEIIIRGTVKLDYSGLDDSKSVNKFNSAEYAYFFLDQAEETTLDDISVLRASLRLVIDGHKLQPKALFTANPARCWLKDEFIDNPRPDQRFVKALPSDNRHLGQSYIETLQRSFAHRPELLAAYLDGSWDCFEGSNQLIREIWLRDARGRTLRPDQSFRVVACDPARFGDDETVIYSLTNTQITASNIYGQRDLMQTANELFVEYRRHKADVIAVDAVGLGAGVVDRLREMGAPVLSIQSAGAASDPTRYINVRAEMWDNAAQMMAQGEIALDHDDGLLAAQLCTPSYKFAAGGKLQVEAKDEIKARLNRSPDRADAYVMGLYALAWLRSKRAKLPHGVTYHQPPIEQQSPPAGSWAARRAAYEAEQRAKEEVAW